MAQVALTENAEDDRGDHSEAQHQRSRYPDCRSVHDPGSDLKLGKIADETVANPLGACAGWAMATILVAFAFLAAIGRLDLVPDLVRTIGNVVGVS